MRKQESLLLITGITLLLLSFSIDLSLLTFFEQIQTPALTLFFTLVSPLGNFLSVSIFLVLLFAIKSRKNLPIAALTLLFSAAITYLLKLLIGWQRPSTDEFDAFPSGHSAAVFTAYPLLERFFPPSKWIWLGFSLLVLISRMYLGKHYLSDILAGALLGYALSRLSLKFLTKKPSTQHL